MSKILKIPAPLFGKEWAVKSRSLKEAWDNYDEEVEILHEFTILHEGWEMDNEGYVVRRYDGSIHYLTTSHGWWQIDNIESLQRTLEKTEQSAIGIRKAIEILSHSNGKD